MNNVMTKGFCELNENEMMGVDGGWDGWMWAKGCGQVIAGGAGCAASAVITVVAPYSAPVTSQTFAASGLMYANGISTIYHSFDY